MGKVKPKHAWSSRYFKHQENDRRVSLTNLHIKSSQELVPQTQTYSARPCAEDEPESLPHTNTCNKSIHSSNASENSYGKLIPLKPEPRYGNGQDLNIPDLEITHVTDNLNELQVTDAYSSQHPGDQYQILCLDPTNNFPVAVTESERTPCNIDAVNYVTNHLSNIEITRIHAQELPSVSKLHALVAPQSLVYSTQRSQQLPAQNNCQVSEVPKRNSDLSRNITARKSAQVRRRKPLIPEDVKHVFQSAGIDENLASDVIVDNNIDNFRENMSRLSDKQEVKDRLKEIRRKGKNRNAAKKSRRSMLERMGRLRDTVAHLSDVLNYKKALMKKIQIWKDRYERYTSIRLEWQSHEQERKLGKKFDPGGILQ